MDDCRFDNLTRAFARGRSRRHVLKGLVGGLAGGLAAIRASSDDALAARNQPAGASCASGRDCASRFCADGVCCASPCLGQCEACNLPGLAGVCSPVSGAPIGNRAACPGADECAPTCDGVTTTRCAGFPGGETTCGASPTCVNGWQTTSACAGNGTCAPTTISCGLFVCDPAGAACLTTCASNADCLGHAHCAGGVCQGDKGLGESCATADECQFGQCIDGFCCNAACGACERCDVQGQEGFCAPVNGFLNTCPEGVCCDGACCAPGQECIDGTCQDPACRVLTETCISADQCCQDEPTLCEVVPQSGRNDAECCRPPGGACVEQFVDCCGTDECIGGVCSPNCHPFGLECFVDDHCCDGLFCVNSICREAEETCLALLETCDTEDQCCDDEPTGCADVVGCGGDRTQCCRLPGGACTASCECCGVDQCVDGACVANCAELGDDCTADDHCCTGICDAGGRCFDPSLAVACDNPADPETCQFPGACQGCEIDGACITSCNDAPLACVTTTEGANACIIAEAVVGRGCVRSSDCGVGRSCYEDCNGDRGCFDAPIDICIFPA